MAAAIDQLQGLNTLLDTITKIKGGSATQTKTQKGTQTTRSNISDEGMDRVVQQILSGPGGIKDISGAARGAGLYNASTELQLLNDLAARVSGEAEKQRAGTDTITDTTTTATIQQPGAGLGTSLALLAAPSAIKGLSSGLSALLGTGAEAAASDIATTALSNLNVDSLFDMSSSLGTSLGEGFTTSAAFDLGSSALPPGVGNVIGGLLGGGKMEDAGGLGLLTSVISGFSAGGPVGALLAPMFGVLGGGLGDLSIVCTALRSKGLLDNEEYNKGQAYLQTLSPYTKAGYYKLFTPLANKILADNKWAIKLALPWARSRTSFIAAGSGIKRWFKYPLGVITLLVGQPLCYVIGVLLSKVKYSTAQGV